MNDTTPTATPEFVRTLEQEQPDDRLRRHLADVLAQFRRRLSVARSKDTPVLNDQRQAIRDMVERALRESIDITALREEFQKELRDAGPHFA
jgi:hypothetical protein